MPKFKVQITDTLKIRREKTVEVEAEDEETAIEMVEGDGDLYMCQEAGIDGKTDPEEYQVDNEPYIATIVE